MPHQSLNPAEFERANHTGKLRQIYSMGDDGSSLVKEVEHINAYLVPGTNTVVEKVVSPLAEITAMDRGSGPVDDGHLFLKFQVKEQLIQAWPQAQAFIRNCFNSEEFINGKQRNSLWLDVDDAAEALKIPEIQQRVERVRQMRLASPKKQTQQEANTPYRFTEIRHQSSKVTIVVPRVSSENRP